MLDPYIRATLQHDSQVVTCLTLCCWRVHSMQICRS